MKYLVIENEGEAEIAALQLLGASDKLAAGPPTIGKFGSGFKYAVAAALRNGIDLFLTVGKKRVTFGTKEIELRGRTIRGITMKVGLGRHKLRDWTVEMGEADWVANPDLGLTPEWMIVRELVSNALDEKGAGDVYTSTIRPPERGVTRVYLELVPGVAEVHGGIGQYFLQYASIEPIHASGGVSIYPRTGETGRIYSRGVFVQCPKKPLLFNYDFDHLTLSESRTVDLYALQAAIGRFMATLPRELLEDVTKRVVLDKPFEAGIQAYQFGAMPKDLDMTGLPDTWQEAMSGKRTVESLLSDAEYHLREAAGCLEKLPQDERSRILQKYIGRLCAWSELEAAVA